METEFKIGDHVMHRSTQDFEMIIIDFAKKWENNMTKNLTVPNPKYPICRYYNRDTKKWEIQEFHDFELEYSDEDLNDEYFNDKE